MNKELEMWKGRMRKQMPKKLTPGMARVKLHHKWKWLVQIFGANQDHVKDCMTQKEVLDFVKENFKLLNEGNTILITKGRK